MNSCEIVEIKKCQINCSVRYTVYNFCEMVFKVNISMIFIILAPLDLRNVFSENLNHIVGMHWKPTIKNNFVPIQVLILASGSMNLFNCHGLLS